jgi:hypothetical protein
LHELDKEPAMDDLGRLEDKGMAMEFAFMCLAKALHERGVLPLPVLAEHLQLAADQMMDSGGLGPVAEQVTALRGTLVQLQ